MKFFSFLFLISLFGSCTATYVRYTDMPHVENVQRIKVISKSKLRYEVLVHHSSKVLRDTIFIYKPCKALEVGQESDNCLHHLERGHVIEFKGSYYIKSSAWINYVGQEKYKKYINKDVKF